MLRPPVRMRKGFDRKLAVALQTTRAILFSEWRRVTPDHKADHSSYIDYSLLPNVDGSKQDVPWSHEDEQLHKALQMILNLLSPDEQEWLLLQVSLKVIEKRDQRSVFFRDILDRLKITERWLEAVKDEL